MILVAVLLALGSTPTEAHTGLLCDTVDLVEVNHYYDDKGMHVFDQLIFYDWCTTANRYQVRAWRLLKSTQQLPQREWRGGGYTVLWHDGEEVTRRVQARCYRETWTQYDPELLERDTLPKERRRRLSRARPVDGQE